MSEVPLYGLEVQGVKFMFSLPPTPLKTRPVRESREFTGFRQKLTVTLMELTFGTASHQVWRRSTSPGSRRSFILRPLWTPYVYGPTS